MAVALPAWRRRRRRKQTKLPHHPDIIPVRKVLSNPAIEHPIHVDVLNLERPPGGLDTDQHPAIDRKLRRALVRAAVSASDNYSPSATEFRIVSRASGKLVLISPNTFRTPARPTCLPWFRQSSVKQLDAASRSPRLNASLNCSAMRRLVSVMSKEGLPFAATSAE
jgi:hypothetical protein